MSCTCDRARANARVWCSAPDAWRAIIRIATRRRRVAGDAAGPPESESGRVGIDVPTRAPDEAVAPVRRTTAVLAKAAGQRTAGAIDGFGVRCRERVLAGDCPAAALLEELERHLGRLVRLGEDGHRGLLQDLGAGHLGNGSGDISVSNAAVRGPGVLGCNPEAVDR